MLPRSFDVIVIGTGPGGEGAAMQAAKRGRAVAVIERYEQVGGGCTHWNTIPSKALRYAVKTFTDFRRNPLLQGMMQSISWSPPDRAPTIRRRSTSRTRASSTRTPCCA